MVGNIQTHWDWKIEDKEKYRIEDVEREIDYVVYQSIVWKSDIEDKIGFIE